jgi:hypothetical protein
MGHPHSNPLGNKEGLLGRVAPYAGVALLGSALIPVMNLEAGAAFVVAIVGVTVAIVTSPWWVPWERLPYSAQSIRRSHIWWWSPFFVTPTAARPRGMAHSQRWS